MKKILLITLLLPTLTIYSQSKKELKALREGGLYSTGGSKIDKGWYAGLGATYMLAYLNETATINFTDTLNNNINQEYTADPKGKFGLFGEVGFFRMNNKKFINYTDFGLSYKWFRGGEDYTNENFRNDTLFSTITDEGSYSDHIISGHFNAGYRFDKTDDLFFVNGLGINFDYHIITSRNGSLALPNNNFDFPSSFLSEIHYFFGMGFKTGKRLIVMPIIETPIFAAYPFNHIVSTHNYFNTRSRPLILRIRFMFLKKGSSSCPPVFNPMGMDPNNNLTK